MQYVSPHCSILVDVRAHYVETRFGDGAKVGSTPNRPDDAQVAEEEATVLRFQGALDKAAPRPWDLAEVPAKAALRR